jgi:hypothetical protein
MPNRRRKFFAMVAVCSAGVLLQTGLFPTSCAQFLGQTLVTSFDFCSVFNCTDGAFFNLCEPFPLLVDCPTIQSTQP